MKAELGQWRARSCGWGVQGNVCPDHGLWMAGIVRASHLPVLVDTGPRGQFLPLIRLASRRQRRGSYETTGRRGAGRRLRSTVTEHEGSRSTVTVDGYGDEIGGIGGTGGIARRGPAFAKPTARQAAASTGTIGDYPSGVVYPGPNRGSRVASRGSSGTPRDGGIARRRTRLREACGAAGRRLHWACRASNRGPVSLSDQSGRPRPEAGLV